MKKFLVILLVIGLLSCILCVGVSADELVRGKDIVDSGAIRSVPDVSSGYPYLYVFNTEVTGSNAAVLAQFLCDDVLYYGIYYNGNGFMVFYTNSSHSSQMTVMQNGSWDSDTYRTLYFSTPVSSLESRDFLNANEYNHFAPNVGTSLSFFGQVLSWLTSTPAILALVGLSIAFAIIPFAVGKVKELIKGY